MLYRFPGSVQTLSMRTRGQVAALNKEAALKEVQETEEVARNASQSEKTLAL